MNSSFLRAGGSVDTELDRIHMEVDTPIKQTPKRSVFGSIERGMDRLITMLTPKKRHGSQDVPRKVKVSSGQSFTASTDCLHLFKAILFLSQTANTC